MAILIIENIGWYNSPALAATPPALKENNDVHPDDGFELVRNGDFSHRGDLWKKTDQYRDYHDSNRMAVSTFKIENNSAKIQVQNRGSKFWHSRLQQAGLFLEKGKKYQISLRAKADGTGPGNQSISVNIALSQVLSYHETYFNGTIKIFGNTDWQLIKLETESTVTDGFVSLEINYGQPTHDSGEPEKFTLWLDDISVKKIGDNRNPYPFPYRTYTGNGRHLPVASLGQLNVNQYGQIESERLGKPLQLRGMSFHGIHWDGPWTYANREVLFEVKEKWNVDVVRIPIYLTEGGYLEDDSVLYTATQIIDAAIELDLYVIIDWHVHNGCGDPNDHIDAASTFFGKMSELYGHTPNVLFEIANEPNGVSWEEIKQYADTIVSVIRQHSSNIVIVGAPGWSQDLLSIVHNPIDGSNVLYSLHFYAASHSLDHFSINIEEVMEAKLGLFVTEFGSTSYDGDSRLDFAVTTKWLDFLDDRGISWVYWNLSAEDQASAALKVGTNPSPTLQNAWQDSDLSASGLFIKNRMNVPSPYNSTNSPTSIRSTP